MKRIGGLIKNSILILVLFIGLIVGGTVVVQDALNNDKTVKVENVVEAVSDESRSARVETNACKADLNEKTIEYDRHDVLLACVNKPSLPVGLTEEQVTKIAKEVVDSTPKARQ